MFVANYTPPCRPLGCRLRLPNLAVIAVGHRRWADLAILLVRCNFEILLSVFHKIPLSKANEVLMRLSSEVC